MKLYDFSRSPIVKVLKYIYDKAISKVLSGILRGLNWALSRIWVCVLISVFIPALAIFIGFLGGLRFTATQEIDEYSGRFYVEDLVGEEPDYVSAHGIKVFCGSANCPAPEDIDAVVSYFIYNYKDVYNYKAMRDAVSRAHVLFRVPVRRGNCAWSEVGGLTCNKGCAKGLHYPVDEDKCGIEISARGEEMATLAHELLHCVEFVTDTDDGDHSNTRWERMEQVE